MDLYSFAGPIARVTPPEFAHRAAILALRHFGSSKTLADHESLRTSIWGLEFSNPVGLAAGFDKNAEVFDTFPEVGFVEVGTVTPRPQPGNPRPRVFRLPQSGAVINRLGFNNAGLEAVRTRLAGPRSRPVGVNIGCNREASDRIADYVLGLQRLGPLADYLAINVSSPNTPGLRDLQGRGELESLLSACLRTREALGLRRDLPVLIKLSPDLEPGPLEEAVGVSVDSGIDGIIVTNTTMKRPAALRGRNREEAGGLSGQPLFQRSTDVLRSVARLTRGETPLVGVGGVGTGAQAYAKIKAGATLVQLYTGLVYRGPRLLADIKSYLIAALQRDGLSSLEEAVGVET